MVVGPTSAVTRSIIVPSSFRVRDIAGTTRIVLCLVDGSMADIFGTCAFISGGVDACASRKTRIYCMGSIDPSSAGVNTRRQVELNAFNPDPSYVFRRHVDERRLHNTSIMCPRSLALSCASSAQFVASELISGTKPGVLRFT